MYITGIIYSSTILLFYLCWFVLFVVDFNYIYDYTVMCDCLVVFGCLIMDTASADKLLNYALALCSLLSVALRYVNRDCSGCDPQSCSDSNICLFNSCCSLRSYTNIVINLVPLATACGRIISIRRHRNKSNV
jgi:hypothetical protein